jgi:hypothetical protein
MVDSGEFELPIFGLRDRRLAAWPKNLIVKVELKSRDKSARVGRVYVAWCVLDSTKRSSYLARTRTLPRPCEEHPRIPHLPSRLETHTL